MISWISVTKTYQVIQLIFRKLFWF